MRPAVSLGLVCAIGAAVVLGLTTFCAPINKNLWLFSIKLPEVKLHCGVFGFCANAKCSEPSLGYTFDHMSIPGTNKSLPNKGTLITDLTYVLVLFPVAFGLAVLAALVAFVAQFRSIGLVVFAALLSFLGAIVSTVGFAIVFVLYFYARNHLDAGSVVDYGTALWLSVAGAAALYAAGIMISIGACMKSTGRGPRKDNPAFYRQLFAAPEHQTGISETYPAEHYALQPRDAMGRKQDGVSDMSLSQLDNSYMSDVPKAPSHNYYLNVPANDTSLTLHDDDYAQYAQPYAYSDSQPFLAMEPTTTMPGTAAPLVDASALVPHVTQPPNYAHSNALQPEKQR